MSRVKIIPGPPQTQNVAPGASPPFLMLLAQASEATVDPVEDPIRNNSQPRDKIFLSDVSCISLGFISIVV